MKCQALDPFRMPDNFNIFLYGDTQWGNVGTHEKGFDKFLGMVCSEYRGCKHNFAIHMGDHIEAITVTDKRFAFDQLKPKSYFLRSQIDHAIAREKELNGKQLLGLNGNHEWIWANTYGDIAAEICDNLKCQYGQRSAVVRFIRKKNGSLISRLHVHHGFGRLTSAAKDPVQRKANMEASLKLKLSGLFDGAIVHAMGHTHQLLIVPPDNSVKMVARNDGEIQQAYPLDDEFIHTDQAADYISPELRWYVNTGSFLRTYSEEGVSYAEAGGMRPVELGFAVLTYRDCRLTKVFKEIV